MDDIAILEAADDLDDRIDLADGREELVAETFALAGAADQAGNVYEFDLSLDFLRGLCNRGDLVEPSVRHSDPADITILTPMRVTRAWATPAQRIAVPAVATKVTPVFNADQWRTFCT